MVSKKFQDFVVRKLTEFGENPSPLGFGYDASSVMPFGILAFGLHQVKDRRELRAKHENRKFVRSRLK